jgi:3D (Asp-Asp-Asp) domain-containing protein
MVSPYPYLVSKNDHKVKLIKTTAYTEKEADHKKYKKLTANGGTLKSRFSAAADWSIFPVGTVLKINNHNYQVSDYGSALVKPLGSVPVVDIYQPSKSAMNEWGVRYFDNVEVVEWGNFHESAKILQDRLKYAHCKTMYDRIQPKL